jgi:hypothetical protein
MILIYRRIVPMVNGVQFTLFSTGLQPLLINTEIPSLLQLEREGGKKEKRVTSVPENPCATFDIE